MCIPYAWRDLTELREHVAQYFLFYEKWVLVRRCAYACVRAMLERPWAPSPISHVCELRLFPLATSVLHECSARIVFSLVEVIT